MRKRLVLGATALMLVGCTAKSPTASDTANDEAADEGTSWTFRRSMSGIDGSVVTASKVVRLEPDTTLYVELACKEDRRIPSLSLQSVVGDVANPDERSAFASTVALTGFVNEMVPLGRLKMADQATSTLSPKFRIDDAYANKMVMNALFVREMKFPMIFEFSNGAGQYEVHLENAQAVDQVLEACGLPSYAQSSNPDDASLSPQQSREASAPSTTSSLNPSFSCQNASTKVEKMICGNPELSRLDAAMAANYQRMLASDLGGAEDSLRSSQREWVRTRNTCQEEKCLKDAYSDRLDAICEYPVAAGTHPECLGSEDIL